MKTFREQFDKLVKAYMSDEVDPWKNCACFIGNLLNKRGDWAGSRKVFRPKEKLLIFEKTIMDTDYYLGYKCVSEQSDNTYTIQDIVRLENIFLTTYTTQGETEDALFNAFEAAITELRKIHESKGEVVEDYSFTKRELV